MRSSSRLTRGRHTLRLASCFGSVGLLTAGMTSFYMFRLWFKTFFGAERFDEHASW